ncbi:hypothetical protein [Salegentibacter mishustinae]|uniref:DUF3872 domain-containing protein n=1 Tax=Salegentibacter mishustinae TaxID=270918 RepID=A0A0Q9Z7V3_9FLAO|nr:hypothetical protein [Salegentibacter mishustinae]KRG29008.1 hypothetical protein APR42_03520 [Salegentibacter mishustinae]PNW21941.1 hypothetical protein APB85_11975 [Salegentibacter mishustinae]PZX65293.1 hypothetical protein LY54_01586 [Salegentibacter mishustinae]GGW86033.1 hypothetical protein GCM10008086_12900 [Salegentibacter mishustinae]
MKNIAKILLSGLIAITAISCYSDDLWLEENVEETGRSTPIIASFTTSDEDYSSGSEITLDLRYWSNDSIEQVDFFAQVDGHPELDDLRVFPYEEAYSELSRTDSLLINYTVPDVPSGTEFEFQVVVRNVNGLTATLDEVRESPTGVPQGRDGGVIDFEVE